MENITSASVNATNHLNVSGIIIGCFTLAIMITALIGNFFVLLAIARTKSLQRLNNYLILSLALSDFGVALLGMPFFINEQFQGGWFLHDSACMLYQVLDISFDVLSVVNLTAISIERVFIIAQPLSYHRLVTSCRMIMLIVFMWLICFTYGSLQVLWFQTEEYAEFKARFPNSCSYYPSLAFAIIDVVFTFIIPLIIMFTAYFNIFRIVNSHMSRIHGRQSMTSDRATADFSTYAPGHLYSESQMAWTNEDRPIDRDSGYNTLSHSHTIRPSVSTTKGQSDDINSPAVLPRKRRKTDQPKVDHMLQNISRPRAFTMPTKFNDITLQGCAFYPEISSSLYKREKKVPFNQEEKGIFGQSQVFDLKSPRSKSWPHLQNQEELSSGKVKKTTVFPSMLSQITTSEFAYKSEITAKTKRGFYLPRTKTFTTLSILKQSSTFDKENEEDNRRTSVTFYLPKYSRQKTQIKESQPNTKNVACDSKQITTERILNDTSRETEQLPGSSGEAKINNFTLTSQRKARSVSQTETIKTSKTSQETSDAPTVELSSGVDQDLPSQQRRRRSSIRTVIRENKAVKMTATVIGAFVLCWMPYEITFVTNRACDACLPPTIINALLALVYFSSAINPFIYNFYSKEFRKAIRKSILCDKNTVQPTQENT